MNFWFIGLLIVAIALILGPIAMLRPNPAQKRKEQLRKHASEQGIRFTMRRLPALKTNMEAPPVVPVYFLPPPVNAQFQDDWILMRTEYEHEGNFYREWDWQGGARPSEAICKTLKASLPDLPLSVPAIAQGKSGSCIFWREIEGEVELAKLISLLRALDAQLNRVA